MRFVDCSCLFSTAVIVVSHVKFACIPICIMKRICIFTFFQERFDGLPGHTLSRGRYMVAPMHCPQSGSTVT